MLLNGLTFKPKTEKEVKKSYNWKIIKRKYKITKISYGHNYVKFD